MFGAGEGRDLYYANVFIFTAVLNEYYFTGDTVTYRIIRLTSKKKMR